VFFRRQAADDQIDDRDKKRYARIVILLMAFYLESMSNLLFGELVNKKLKIIGKQIYLPPKMAKPIKHLKAVHHELFGKELSLDTDGLEDIFTVRNIIIAHPAGRAQSQTGTGEDVWSRLGRNITYKKFRHLPLHYSHFTLNHADELLKEVKEFLTKFLVLLRDKVPKEQVDEWWPGELVEWSEEVNKHWGTLCFILLTMKVCPPPPHPTKTPLVGENRRLDFDYRACHPYVT